MDSRKKWFVVCLLGIGLFMTACSREKQEKTFYLNQGNELVRKEKFAEAEKAFLQAIVLDDQYKEAYVQLGKVQLRQGALREAVTSFSRAAEIDPQDMDIQVRLATFHMLEKNASAAMHILDTVLGQDAGNIEALFLKGSIMLRQEALPQARGLFKKIIELDLSQVRAYLALVKIQTMLGETDAVVSTLQTAIQNNPHALDLKLALVDRYMAMKKTTDAQAVLLGALQHEPGNAKLQELMATFYFQTGQMEKAESAYKDAVTLSPGQIGPLMQLARFYNLTGEEPRAAQVYERVLRMAPNNVQVLDSIARFYARSGKPEQAEQCVSDALHANPLFLPSRMLQAELALEKGDCETALQLSQTLIDEGKDLPKIHYIKARSLLALKQYTSAVESFERVIKAWPQCIAARSGLARALYHINEPGQARTQSMIVLRQDPVNPEALVLLGNVAEGHGDFHDAETYYRRALTINSHYGPAATGLASILIRQGNLNQAFDLATLAFEQIPMDPQVLDVLGLIYLKWGEPELALDYLNRSVAGSPDNPVCLYHLGLAHWKKGNTNEACRLLNRALENRIPFREREHARDVLNNLEKEQAAGNTEDR